MPKVQQPNIDFVDSPSDDYENYSIFVERQVGYSIFVEWGSVEIY